MTDAPDLGAPGPAALARPRREIEWQRKISATRSVTERRTVYADVILIDRLHDAGLIRPREWQAGYRLYALFLSAGLGPRTTQRQDVIREGEPEDGWEDAAEGDGGEDAKVAYRAVLRKAGAIRGPTLDGVMHGTLDAWRGGSASRALGWLADFWGM